MRKGMHTSRRPASAKVWVPEAVKPLPTVELVVDHILQPLQPLEDGLPVHQVWNFPSPGSQSLVRDAPDLDELLGSVLDPAVDREQDNPHEHQDVDGQQSFDFACHRHERRIEVWTPVKPSSCPCAVVCSPLSSESLWGLRREGQSAEVLKETRSAPRTARQPARASSAGQRGRHMEDRTAADAVRTTQSCARCLQLHKRRHATFRCNTLLQSKGTRRQFLSPSKCAPSYVRCVGIIARIDASSDCRVALTSPLTEAVWSLDASRSVREKKHSCLINKAAFGVSPLLFLAPLVQRWRQSMAAAGFEHQADEPELRADLPSSAVVE